MNIFLTDSNVIELNSTEMNEIMGGSWLSKAWQFICDAYYDLVVRTEDYE